MRTPDPCSMRLAALEVRMHLPFFYQKSIFAKNSTTDYMLYCEQGGADRYDDDPGVIVSFDMAARMLNCYHIISLLSACRHATMRPPCICSMHTLSWESISLQRKRFAVPLLRLLWRRQSWHTSHRVQYIEQVWKEVHCCLPG